MFETKMIQHETNEQSNAGDCNAEAEISKRTVCVGVLFVEKPRSFKILHKIFSFPLIILNFI